MKDYQRQFRDTEKTLFRQRKNANTGVLFGILAAIIWLMETSTYYRQCTISKSLYEGDMTASLHLIGITIIAIGSLVIWGYKISKTNKRISQKAEIFIQCEICPDLINALRTKIPMLNTDALQKKLLPALAHFRWNEKIDESAWLGFDPTEEDEDILVTIDEEPYYLTDIEWDINNPNFVFRLEHKDTNEIREIQAERP